jgi:hypothetical protein
MPQCQFPVFCYFCVSEKLHRKYSRNWMKQKLNLLFLLKLHEVQRWDGGGLGASHTLGWRSLPLARATGVRPAGPPSDAALSPIYSPRWEKPRGWIAFSRDILQAAAIIARSRGSRSSSRYPTGEGNPCRRPSPPPWSPPEWCVSSLTWTTGP